MMQLIFNLTSFCCYNTQITTSAVSIVKNTPKTENEETKNTAWKQINDSLKPFTRMLLCVCQLKKCIHSFKKQTWNISTLNEKSSTAFMAWFVIWFCTIRMRPCKLSLLAIWPAILRIALTFTAPVPQKITRTCKINYQFWNNT